MARRRRKRTTRPGSGNAPGWIWMLFGLAIGLTIALAIYLRQERPATLSAPARSPQAASVVEDDRDEAVAAAPAKPKYEFYDMLPNFEVIVPEEDLETKRVAPSETVARAGIYELQTGSFAAFEDADRMRARLALLGIESRVQRVSVDTKTYHRVRIGPIDDLDRLNDLLDSLARADIATLTIRVGE